MILFIIAGHGAGDSGAVGNGFQEAERVRALATRIQQLGGSQVVLGDFNKNYYKSNGIASLALPKGAQILELHVDSGESTARGAHVVIRLGFTPDAYDMALADRITEILPGRASKIVGRSDLQNPNVAAKKGYPYRLLECGFISNAEDVKIFNSRMDEIAGRILDAFGIAAGTASSAPAVPVVPQKPSGYKGPVLSFEYEVRAGGKTWPAVKDLNDWAGKGDGTPITDIAIKVNVGSVRYRVHVLGGGWLPWVTGYNWNDHKNGYAGNGKPIDGVQVYYETPKEYAAKYGYQKAEYRVSSLESREYYSWQNDTETKGGQDGYAGKLGVAVDKFQIH